MRFEPFHLLCCARFELFLFLIRHGLRSFRLLVPALRRFFCFGQVGREHYRQVFALEHIRHVPTVLQAADDQGEAQFLLQREHAVHGLHVFCGKKYRLFFVQHRIKSLQGLVHLRSHHTRGVRGEGCLVRLGLFRLAVQLPEFGHYADYRARVHPARAVERSEHRGIIPHEHFVRAGTCHEEEPTAARQHTALRHYMRHREA